MEWDMSSANAQSDETHSEGHGILHGTHEAMTSRQSLLVTGLDPNPSSAQLGIPEAGRSSLLSQARSWCKSVIEATEDPLPTVAWLLSSHGIGGG